MGNIDANLILGTPPTNILSASASNNNNNNNDYYDDDQLQQQQSPARHEDDRYSDDYNRLNVEYGSSLSSPQNDFTDLLDCQDDDYFYLNENFLSSEFRDKSAEVACDIVTYICSSGFLDPLPPPSKTSQIMRHLVDDLLKNRHDFMYNMATKIASNVRQPENLTTLLNELATQMFDDGIVSWNRIVTFHAFCGSVARISRLERGIVYAEELVIDALTNIIVHRLGLWIVACGGWASFNKQFPAVCIFSLGSLWKFFLFIMFLTSAVFMLYKFTHQLNGSP